MEVWNSAHDWEHKSNAEFCVDAFFVWTYGGANGAYVLEDITFKKLFNEFTTLYETKNAPLISKLSMVYYDKLRIREIEI
jgi:hypothetical protein